MDCGFPRSCKTFKRDKLAKNDNLTLCGNFIGICYNHFAFSKPAVLVPLTGALTQKEIKLNSLKYASFYALLAYFGLFIFIKDTAIKRLFLITKYTAQRLNNYRNSGADAEVRNQYNLE
jgi:hypothetical protein